MFLINNLEVTPLKSWSSKVCQRCHGPLIIGMFLISVSCAEVAPCRLEIPVYDPFGSRLDFKITKVMPSEGAKVNLLKVRPKEVQLGKDGRLMLDRSLLGRVIEISLEDNRGVKVAQPVFLMQCAQRVSVRVGFSESYGDVTFQTVNGRFSGCRFSGDWWIRAMNMFGPASAVAPLEARVEQDGSFSLSGQMSGERHIIVVGKEKNPIEVIGIDVTVGRSINIGTYDLSGRCPP